MAHHFRGRFVTHKQRDGVNQDGLSSAGLTGQEIQSRTKLDLNLVDNRVILDAKLDEHQPQNSLLRLPKQSDSPRRHGGHGGKLRKNVKTRNRAPERLPF